MPKLIDGIPVTDVDQVVAKQATMADDIKSLNQLTATIQDEHQKYVDNSITKDEFTERMKKIALDVKSLTDAIEVAKNAQVVQSDRAIYRDWKSLLNDTDWMYHDSGTPFVQTEYTSHQLFQMEVDYGKMDEGQELLNLRNLHDASLFINALHTHQNPRYDCRENRVFISLVDATRKFDNDLADAMMGKKQAHAMAGGNTGFGAEWLPTEFSSEFTEIMRLAPTVANRFRTWNIARGQSGTWPFQTSRAVVRRQGESTTDNPPQALKTNAGTGNVTFTPIKFIAAIVQSDEIIEDAIINMVSFIRTELSRATMDSWDSAIINGDTASTHQDNAAAVQWNATTAPETGILGLRAIAFDDSVTVDIEVLSASTGVAALEIGNFIELRGLMVRAGARMSEVFWCTGLLGEGQVANALIKEDALGTWNFITSGKLPQVYGSEVVISQEYLEELESDGLGDTADGTDVHTSILGVHAPSFVKGLRRGITLEVQKDILSQNSVFVSTMRADFQLVAESNADQRPVVNGINIQHSV